MNFVPGPIAAYRRYWLPELLAILALAFAAAALFTVTDLDLSTIRPFYHAGLPDPWPVASQPLWRIFYRSAPWVTGSLSVAGLLVFLAGMVRREFRRCRAYGAFILLCVIIGPGLIVNGVLKDHWGRPRPRQIVAFGGRLPYVPPLLPTGNHGKSFPCGHCSVGYLYGSGWWLWRRRHPRWGALSLAAGITIGTLLGIGRMAAGAHFLSDAIWAALLSFLTAHALYFYVLRIPAREDSVASLFPAIERSERRKTAVIAFSILLAAGIVVGGLLASPHDKELAAPVHLSDFHPSPVTIEVVVDTLNVELLLVSEPLDDIECTGSIHGFGLPTNHIRAGWEFRERPVPTLRYLVSEKGWFTDIEGVVQIRLPVGALRRIIVRVGTGNILVTDVAARSPGKGPLPELDLHTGNGRVQRP